MKTCDEMVNSLLDRRKRYLAAKKRKRQAWIASGCCALVVLLGIWQVRTIQGNDPANPEPAVIWAEKSVGDEETREWNGKQIAVSLWESLQEYEDTRLFAVTVECRHMDEGFVYNGKPVARYYEETVEKQTALNALDLLLKRSEPEVDGEAHYWATIPTNPEKYASAMQKPIGAFTPENWVEEYYAGGVFLRDKAAADYRRCQAEVASLRKSIAEAGDAYQDAVLETVMAQLTAQGISYEWQENSHLLILYVSEDTLAGLSLDGMSDWYFRLAEKNELN